MLSTTRTTARILPGGNSPSLAATRFAPAILTAPRRLPFTLLVAFTLLLGVAAPLMTPATARAQSRSAQPQSLPNSPEIPSGNINAAAAYAREQKGKAFLVIQNGRVIKEEYTDGLGADARHGILSGTKAVWVMAVLAMADDRMLTLDEPASNTISEWKDDPDKSQITIRQLLNFTSGLPVAGHIHRITLDDRFKSTMELKFIGKPGERFAYGPAHLAVIYEIMRRKLRSRFSTPWDYMRGKIAAPLGLPVTNDRPDKAGQPLLASGFKFTAQQWANVGKLLLNQGYYPPRARYVVSRGVFQQMLQTSTPNPHFGLGLWVNRNTSASARELNVEDILDLDIEEQHWGNGCLSRVAPADLFVSLGSGGQRLYIVPSRNLIIVRMGSGKFADPTFLRLLFKK
ncbi:MAG TPA: serine hydrolase [Candidatus Methylacidiphilales bacterium]|nr:serine hydrolase [Candidatus Methylacidiphilales bacterium]